MKKKKDTFELGRDVEEALLALVSINSDTASAAKSKPVASEPAPGPEKQQPAATAADAPATPVPAAPRAVMPQGTAELDLPALFCAMKPRTMCALLWLLLFQWQARRTGGVINLNEFAQQFGVKREKVADALRALAKSGRITVTATTYGPRRSVASRTITVNPLGE